MKKILIGSLLSLAVFFGSATSLLSLQNQSVQAQETIELNFGQAAKDAEVAGTENYDPEDGEAGFSSFLTQILNIVVVIAALLLLLYLIWGGIEWITSGGDKSKTEKARSRITQSVVGIIVLASTIALFMMIQSFLGFEVINFGTSGKTKGKTPTPTPVTRERS